MLIGAWTDYDGLVGFSSALFVCSCCVWIKNIVEAYFAFVVFQNHLNEISSQIHLPIRSHIQWNFTNDECAMCDKAVVFPRHFVQISAQAVLPIFFETQAWRFLVINHYLVRGPSVPLTLSIAPFIIHLTSKGILRWVNIYSVDSTRSNIIWMYA